MSQPRLHLAVYCSPSGEWVGEVKRDDVALFAGLWPGPDEAWRALTEWARRHGHLPDLTGRAAHRKAVR